MEWSGSFIRVTWLKNPQKDGRQKIVSVEDKIGGKVSLEDGSVFQNLAPPCAYSSASSAHGNCQGRTVPGTSFCQLHTCHCPAHRMAEQLHQQALPCSAGPWTSRPTLQRHPAHIALCVVTVKDAPCQTPRFVSCTHALLSDAPLQKPRAYNSAQHMEWQNNLIRETRWLQNHVSGMASRVINLISGMGQLDTVSGSTACVAALKMCLTVHASPALAVMFF